MKYGIDIYAPSGALIRNKEEQTYDYLDDAIGDALCYVEDDNCYCEVYEFTESGYCLVRKISQLCV